MGLDFSVYKKKLNETCEEAIMNEDNELAYGRKSWELVYVLVPDYQEYYKDDNYDDPILKPERWAELMNKLKKIGPKLDTVLQAFDIVENAPDDFPEMVVTDEVKRSIAEYELWYNREFDSSPILGYRFSAGYMKDFWDARDEVQKYLDDPDYEVLACVSY